MGEVETEQFLNKARPLWTGANETVDAFAAERGTPTHSRLRKMGRVLNVPWDGAQGRQVMG